MDYGVFALASALALQGCQRTEPAKSQPIAETTTIAAHAPKRGEPLDVHGITVTFRDELPVLSRSLTAEQSVGLRELVPPK